MSEPDDEGAIERARLVLSLRARGIMDANILKAIEQTPRALFVDESLAEFAHDDRALPIECGQTISQPFIVAFMTQALKIGPRDKVLEIGTGSGYQTAVLARLCRRVYSIERYRRLKELAEARLQKLRISNTTLMHGDGRAGWPPQAPFDGIIVTAAGDSAPQALLDQLKPGGIMVMPVGGEADVQKLIRFTKQEDGSVTQDTLLDVRFVPLVPGKAEHA